MIKITACVLCMFFHIILKLNSHFLVQLHHFVCLCVYCVVWPHRNWHNRKFTIIFYGTFLWFHGFFFIRRRYTRGTRFLLYSEMMCVSVLGILYENSHQYHNHREVKWLKRFYDSPNIRFVFFAVLQKRKFLPFKSRKKEFYLANKRNGIIIHWNHEVIRTIELGW